MNVKKLLQLAGVPPTLWPDAQAAIDAARAATGGTLDVMLWRKHRARWFRSSRIAKALPWEANHLIDVRPDWADDDIAPMLNITCNGDNVEWIETPQGGRPNPNAWRNPDPASDEYQRAVAACYWCPGHHPRSPEARRAWYMRNAGEHLAWRLGTAVDPANPVQEWTGPNVRVLRCGDVWQVSGLQTIAGPLKWHIDIGYEINNVFGIVGGKRVQCWYPLEGYELRACAVWAVYPTLA
ncbi:MAG: hypothetical protein LT082_08980 [Comamonas sp.]|nr:hypothetical protein [Comamonas sp.]